MPKMFAGHSNLDTMASTIFNMFQATTASTAETVAKRPFLVPGGKPYRRAQHWSHQPLMDIGYQWAMPCFSMANYEPQEVNHLGVYYIISWYHVGKAIRSIIHDLPSTILP
jgi:hypothetical protein